MLSGNLMGDNKMIKQNPFGSQITFSNEHIDHVSDYDVIWRTQSDCSRDSMPYGDGETGVNIWVEKENGLYLLVGRTDVKEHNKLVRLHLQTSPNVFGSDYFRQNLRLYDGYIEIECEAGQFKIWMDADQQLEDLSVLSIEGQLSQPVAITASLEHWRECDELSDSEQICREMALDDHYAFLEDQHATWFLHTNNCESAHDTFIVGAQLAGEGFKRLNARQVGTVKDCREFKVQFTVYAADTDTPAKWKQLFDKQAAQYAAGTDHEQKHRDFWNDFWSRNEISIRNTSVAHRINSQYVMSRYLLACCCRGLFPCLYNGSIFRTEVEREAVAAFSWVSEEKTNADMRPWGSDYMGQNLRHIFWPMITSGDFDLMKPLLRLIRGVLPRQRKLTWETMGHDGAYIQEKFTSAQYTWKDGDIACPDEQNRLSRPQDCWENADWHLKYHFLPTIEFAVMFMDLYLHTRDKKLLDEICLPYLRMCVMFYENHYPQLDENGKRIIFPASTTETYGKARSKWHDFSQYEDVKNPITEVSGLRCLLSEVLQLCAEELPEDQRKYYAEFLGQLPEIPYKQFSSVNLLAPGESYTPGLLCESSELYAVWPFRQNTFRSGLEEKAAARQSFFTRMISLDGSDDIQPFETGGWHPAGLDAAVLGLTKEAERILEINNSDTLPAISVIGDVEYKDRPTKPRFEGFWNHGHMDGIPDFCHLGVTMNLLQQMLLQWDGEKIYLLPAWNSAWDVHFKLYAPNKTMVECEFVSGRIKTLRVIPENRASDIVDCQQPAYQITRMFEIKAGDRNRIFNLPDMADGTVVREDLFRRPLLKPWLIRYGESLLDTQPYYQDNRVRLVFCRDNILYIAARPDEQTVCIDKNGFSVLQADCLTGGKVEFTQTEKEAFFRLEECEADPLRIVKVICDRDIIPLMHKNNITYTVSASSRLSDAFHETNITTVDRQSYWLKGFEDTAPELVCRFSEPQLVAGAELLLRTDIRTYGNRTHFSLEYEDKTGVWHKLFDTVAFNEFWGQKFQPVLAVAFRFRFSGDENTGVRSITFYSSLPQTK